MKMVVVLWLVQLHVGLGSGNSRFLPFLWEVQCDDKSLAEPRYCSHAKISGYLVRCHHRTPCWLSICVWWPPKVTHRGGKKGTDLKSEDLLKGGRAGESWCLFVMRLTPPIILASALLLLIWPHVSGIKLNCCHGDRLTYLCRPPYKSCWVISSVQECAVTKSNHCQKNKEAILCSC